MTQTQIDVQLQMEKTQRNMSVFYLNLKHCDLWVFSHMISTITAHKTSMYRIIKNGEFAKSWITSMPWPRNTLLKALGIASIYKLLFKPVLHNWLNKDHGKCYLVCGMVHIKYPLLLIEKSSPCSVGSRVFSLSLSDWSLTICSVLYNRAYNMLSALLINKYIHPF